MRRYFTLLEILLWSFSVALIIASFLIFDRESYLTLVASVLGATFLILNAKGNPLGQFLTIIFSILYGIISYSCDYYGEMINYLGMTAPMAALALVSWIRNPFEGNRSEVEVSKLSRRDVILTPTLATITTVIFYFILKAFNTANLYPSTLSVTTSFVAVFLTYKRSPYYALGYAANDLVLVYLWILASKENSAYISVVVCFATFFVGDLYGFLNWKRMEKRQGSAQ